MATCVRLKRHRAIIITLYLVVACYPFLLVFFLPFFFIYSVLVARAAVTRFPFAHTHTIYPSIYPFHLSSFSFFFFARQSRRQSPFSVCLFVFFFFIHRRASVFSPLPCFFLSQSRFVRFISFIKSVAIWIYTQQSADTLCDIVAVFQASFWCSRLTASVSMTVCRRWRWRWRWYR